MRTAVKIVCSKLISLVTMVVEQSWTKSDALDHGLLVLYAE